MSVCVFDIETVGLPWLDLDPLLREGITRGAKNGDEYRSRKEWRTLSPYAAKAVVVAVQNPETRQGKVWYESSVPVEGRSGDGLFDLVGCPEAQMLGEFWAAVARFDRLVSFNGRSFDGPFLSVRSALHGIPPTRNLSGYRYSVSDHVDLMEVLTFHGSASAKPTLHAACVAFGIPSPKSAEMHGYAVPQAYRDGRLAEIAEYCRRDVEATAELFRRLEPTLLPLFRR